MANTFKQGLASFWVALQFLTILPVPRQLAVEDKTLASSVQYYPLVGLLIGLILYATSLLLDGLFSSLVISAMLVGIWVVITGALHLDGLADCADAWVGGLGSKERTLEIMKDPTCGPVAVAALLVLLFLKFALLETLISQQAFTALIIAPVFGRMAVSILLLTTNYVRSGGLGEALSAGLSRGKVSGQLAFIMLLTVYLCPAIVLSALGLSLVIFLLWRRMMIKRLGGCTGDTLGAMVELVEVFSLLAMAVLIGVIS